MRRELLVHLLYLAGSLFFVAGTVMAIINMRRQ